MGFKNYNLEKSLQAYNMDTNKERSNIMSTSIYKWKEDDYGVIGNWTGERKNHPWIPLVARTEPRYQLEDR